MRELYAPFFNEYCCPFTCWKNSTFNKNTFTPGPVGTEAGDKLTPVEFPLIGKFTKFVRLISEVFVTKSKAAAAPEMVTCVAPEGNVMSFAGTKPLIAIYPVAGSNAQGLYKMLPSNAP